MIPAIESFNLIVAEPVATIRKFKLMKVFHAILPVNAKELSANEIADIIRKQLEHDATKGK